MKKVYAVTINNGDEGTDVCKLMEGRLSKTAFPGCWEIPENTEEITDRISSTVNGFIGFPDFDCVVFGCSESAADAIIAKLDCDKVKRLTVKQLPEFIGEF